MKANLAIMNPDVLVTQGATCQEIALANPS